MYLVMIENGSLSPDRSTHLGTSSAKGIFAREGSAATTVLNKAAELRGAHGKRGLWSLRKGVPIFFNRRGVVDEARGYADEDLLRDVRIL